MKNNRAILIALATAGLFVATPATANTEALFKAGGCVGCHAVDQQRMGPTLKAVAEKYRGQADAPAKLFDKVRSGGFGVWGQVTMAPVPPDRIADADLKTVIDWILTH